MKHLKFLLLILFFSNYLNGAYLVKYTNGLDYCVHSFSKNDITNNITGDSSLRPYNFIRVNIVSVKNGYIYNHSDDSCKIDLNVENIDLTDFVKNKLYTSNLYKSLTDFEEALKNNDFSLFIIKPVYKFTFEDNFSFCSSGYGSYKGSDKFIVSPEYPNTPYTTINILSKVLKKIQFNYSYNIINNECYLDNSDTAYDLPLSLGKPTTSFNNITQPSEFKAYFDLFAQKDNLPNPNPQINDIIIDTTKASNNCNNDLFTLQDKLLCEINNHLRKINQESNPKYSLNNLIGILNTSHNNNSEELNKEIKALSSYEDVRAKKQEESNQILNNMKTNQESTNESLLNLNSALVDLNVTLNDSKSNDDGTIIVPPQGNSNNSNNSLDLDKYFKPDENVNTNELDSNIEQTDSIIDSLLSIFTDFKSNFVDSFDSINNQILNAKETIQNPQNLFSKSNITSCPVSYEADFTSFGIGKKNVIVDFCEYTSFLRPIVYFFTYVSLFLGFLFFIFRFIGGLI